MMADYVCDARVECATCDVVGTLTCVGTTVVQRITREHRGHEAHYDFTNIRTKREYENERRRQRHLAAVASLKAHA